MPATLAIVLIAFLVLFFVGTCFALYVWWKKSIYTRERFAFAGLTAVCSIALFVLTSLYAQQTPWMAVMGLVSRWSGSLHEPTKPLTPEQGILSVLLLVFIAWFVLRLHRQWDGARSIEQRQREQTAKDPSLWADSYLYLRHFRNVSLLARYEPDSAFRHTMLEGAKDSMAWRDQARDLLRLSGATYEFPDGSWHDSERCWIGKHRGTGDLAVLACRQDQLDENDLQQVVSYVERVRKGQDLSGIGIEFIVAFKDGDVDKKTTVAGYQLRCVSESRLLDNLVDFSDYFEDLRHRVERDTLTESALTIADMYTVSSYKLMKDGDPLPDVEAYLNQWLIEQSKRQLALLGEYGQGKSTASVMLSYHLMQRIEQGDRSARVPILLELRGKSPRTLREDELVSTWAGRYGIDTRALLKLLAAGRLLMILEGFDEVDLSGDVEARLRHFGVMWRLCFPRAKILVTGRPNFFLDDVELKAALGIQEPSLERPYCQALYLVPFSVTQIEDSLRNLDAKSRREIVTLAEHNANFRDIVARPSLLHVVSVLWRKEKLAEYRDRINSAVVMDLFLRHSYRRQGAKGEDRDFMALTHHERAYFMEGIAVYMLVNRLPNQISAGQLDDAVRLLIEAIPDAVSLQTDAASGETRKPLRQRFDFQTQTVERVEHIKTDVRACGLLVTDLSRSDSFKFGHKSFMEFLGGKVFSQWRMSKDLPETERLAAASLANKLGLKMRHVTEQQETLGFAIEWIANKAMRPDETATTLFNTIFGMDRIGARIFGPFLKVCIRISSFLVTRFSESMARHISVASACALAIAFGASMTLWAYGFRGYPEYDRLVKGTVVLLTGAFFFNQAARLHPLRHRAFDPAGMSVVVIGAFAVSTMVVQSLTGLMVAPWLTGLSDGVDRVSATAVVGILVIAVTYLLLETVLGVLRFLPSKKHNEDPQGPWCSLQLWYRACLSARLDRAAMTSVVGGKALCWLERARRPGDQGPRTS